ncbi:hypothetical protein [Woodsholea maritima]|uniref:hypothetical protein n=1 Tax=Woodsholea maritima TaxID=240237 RepID=UPI00035FC2E2|nr:hypothetical protein [Woodsholea maritima]
MSGDGIYRAVGIAVVVVVVIIAGALIWVLGQNRTASVDRPERPSLSQLDDTPRGLDPENPSGRFADTPAQTGQAVSAPEQDGPRWITRDEPSAQPSSGGAIFADQAPAAPSQAGSDKGEGFDLDTPRERLEYFCYERLRETRDHCTCLYLNAQYWFERDELDFFSRFDDAASPATSLRASGFDLADLPQLSGKILLFERRLPEACGFSLAR